MNASKKVYIFALSAILFWSTAAVAFKIALQYMDFIHLLFFASFVSFLVLFTVLLVQNQHKELFNYSKKQYLYSLVLGFLNPFAYYMVLLKAYSILPAQLAQPLNYTWPIMLILLSALLLKQKLSIISLLAALLSFFGVYLISLRGGDFSINIQQPLGILLATGSSVIWALFWIYNIKDPRSELHKLALSFFFSVFFIGFSLFLFSDFQIPETKGLLAAVYTGFFEMSIAYILWLKALKLAKRSDKISNLVFISPFFALLWIHLILGENIYNTTIYGLIFIILGIFIHHFFSKQAKV